MRQASAPQLLLLLALASVALRCQCSSIIDKSAGTIPASASGRLLTAAPAPARQGSTCTVVPGETTDACHSSCQACKDTPGTAADSRQCVCCKAAGWVPNPSTPAACRACPRGWIAQQGELQCNQCQPGYSTLQQGSTVCDACAAGYEGPTCAPCEPGSYSARGPASTAAVGCLPCPLGSSSSKVTATLADCKTADGQGIVSMLATVTLLSPCNASLAAALLPVVEHAVADAAGNNSDAEYDMAAGGCAMRVRAARRRASRPVQAGATEVTAAYSFNVLATSAAGLAPKPLQLELMQRLLGLKLPGFPRLLLVAVGCQGDPDASLLPNALWECSEATASGSSCLADGCAPGFSPSTPLLYASCVAGQWNKEKAAGRCLADCSGNPRGIKPANWNCSSTTVGGLCAATSCRAGFELRGPLQARCQARGWNVISGSCRPRPCFGLPSEAGAGLPWPGCNSSAPIPHNTTCIATCPNRTKRSSTGRAAVSTGVSAQCSFGQWLVTGTCAEAPPVVPAAPGVSWACSEAAPTASGSYCLGSCGQGSGALGGMLLAACSNGSYSISGECVFGSAITCSYPPSSQPGYNRSQCSSGRAGAGQLCVGQCAPGYAASGAITAFCQVTGGHIVQGSCTELPCPNPPNFAAGVAWPCSSGNTSSGTSCKGSCTLGYTGGIAASCKQGSWELVGSCEGPARCDNPPNSLPGFTWPSCATGTAAVQSTCTGSCAATFAASGPISARCNNKGVYEVTGQCSGAPT
uniref:Laminin EGF-like domain-containing protein n=1 Tax=Tetradesmus obliquus TaxID=3088 RepID=A0A383WBR6_TETOB|eukprot:jgi/Sobl393_1/6679/SZX74474.1